jgi:hypothetical protein
VAAVKLLGWKEIPCRILTGDETERAGGIALSENVNRLAMHPLDEAALFSRLLEAGEPIQEIAKRYDRPASGIWQRVQLLDLSPDIREMFRAGQIELQSAAMLKSLDEKEQAEFVKKYKKFANIRIREVSSFIRNLHNDEVYKFLGKECAGCKTRTFFTEKSLFPEIDVREDSCLNHACYVQKWTRLLETRIKSLKGEHRSHTTAALIVYNYSANLEKIIGKSVRLDGADCKIIEDDWQCRSDSGGAGAEPCFFILVDGDKLQVKPAYWKKEKKETTNLKDFSAELKLLDLPKGEDAAVRDALKAKNVSHAGFTDKVRQKVLDRLIAYRAGSKDPPQNDAAILFRDVFQYPSKKKKEIYRLFTGRDYDEKNPGLIPNDRMVLTLLCVLSFSAYYLPPVYSGKESSKVFDWSGLSPDEIKALYREVIRDLLPKPKAGKDAAPGKKDKGKKEG